MKKLLNFFTLIVLLTVFSVSLFACTPTDNEHYHSFNMSYDKDDTYHWYSATCEHVNETKGKEEHVYNGDYVCEKCGFLHNHKYAETYSYDETKHWYDSTCGHGEFKKDLVNHVFDANYICLFCNYNHQHVTDNNGKCACGYDVNEPETVPTDLVGKTFYLQVAVTNEGDGTGDILHEPSEVGYSKDFYNITFTDESKGYANIAMPIDKEITYQIVNGEITLYIYRDTIKSENSNYVYQKEMMKYTGTFKGGRLVLNYKFNSNGKEKTRVYIFEPGDKLTNEYVDYNDFVGKTYSNKKEGQKINYREVTFKENNLADVTFYNYVNGEPVPEKYENCIAILTSKKESETYYYVLRCKVKGYDYDIKFTLDGVVVTFKEVV